MEIPESYVNLANYRLEEAGFSTLDLIDHNLPNILTVKNGDSEPIDIQIHGGIKAPNIVIESTTYLTSLHEKHEPLRVKAKQVALGDDFAVVAVDTFDPQISFTADQRHKLHIGDFSPLSERIFRVINHLDLSDDQKILAYGYSMGADIAVQTAHDNQLNPNRGSVNLIGVGSEEMARCLKRGAISVTLAMAQSGGLLVKNIQDSKVPALDEAWKITGLDNKKATRAINFPVLLNLIKYANSGKRNNWAIINGFGTEKSTDQVLELLNKTELPVFIGRQAMSKVFSADALSKIIFQDKSSNGDYLVENNDHSADDNIRQAAARILYFADRMIN